jgi:DNA repair protein RecN (Recombination protein N)
MLSLLRLTDFAIVERSELEFGPGLNAITGETGAGKSLVVGALRLLVGMRGSSKVVRSGAQAAEIEAQFVNIDNPVSVAALRERGLWDNDGVVVVRRVISARSGHRCFLNGRLATAADLKAVIGPLVDLCGQHQHARLLDPQRQTLILDRFGGLGELAASHRANHQTWCAAAEELQQLEEAVAAREQRRDFLQFCADEIEEAGIVAGEADALGDRARLLHGATELLAATGEAAERLVGETGLRDSVAAIAGDLRRSVGLDKSLAAHASQAEELLTLVDELAADLERYADRVDIDAQARTDVDDRLAVVHRMIRKYGGSEAALLARQAEIDDELHAQHDADGNLTTLRVQVPTLLAAMQASAQALSVARREAAPRLSADAEEVLHALAMGNASVTIDLVALPNIGRTGAERVVLLLRSNLGGPTLPLKDIASGGELSRTLLALERACADPSPSSSAVYDEIDAGLGGETGRLLAQHLKEMATLQQVICITHLPQVAAMAARQLHVSKRSHRNTTSSHVERVDGERRLQELARMLGGASDTTALAHARTLLATPS